MDELEMEQISRYPINNNNNKHKNIKLRVCLGSAYFAKIENFLLKVLQIKVKIN